MAYISEAFLYVPFDEEPFMQMVSSALLTDNGITPTLVDGVFEKAWQMVDTCYLETAATGSLTTSFSIGFWLKSTNPGMVTDPGTLETLPLKMPLISKATFVVGATVTASTYTIIIWEETQSTGGNVLKVKIKGTRSAVTVEPILTSSEYAIGSFHHFWIAYDGGSDIFRLYIDAVEDQSATISGSIPTTLSVNAATFSLNKNVTGELYEIARNSGILDDLVILTSSVTDVQNIARVANNSAAYLIDTDYSTLEEVDCGAVFDDPGTIEVNGITRNRGYLYVGRSDGSILRGSNSLWDSRREFKNTNEMDVLTTTSKSSNSSMAIQDGVLQVEDKVIRI